MIKDDDVEPVFLTRGRDFRERRDATVGRDQDAGAVCSKPTDRLVLQTVALPFAVRNKRPGVDSCIA